MSRATGMWVWRHQLPPDTPEVVIRKQMEDMLLMAGARLMAIALDAREYAITVSDHSRILADDGSTLLGLTMWVLVMFCTQAGVDDLVIAQHPGFPFFQEAKPGDTHLWGGVFEFEAAFFEGQMVGWRRTK